MFLVLLLLLNPAWIPAWGPGVLQFCIDASMEPYRPEATHAFMTWALEAGIAGGETRDCAAPRTVAYRIGNTGTMFGAALYPPPLFPEPFAGDVYLSERLDWQHPANRAILAAVLIHETGHAFGLPHLLGDGDVMNAQIQADRRYPSAVERRMMRCLYRNDCR